MCDKIRRLRELTSEISEEISLVSKLTTALDTSNEGIAILDKDGIYIYLNKAHEQMFKYGSGEMLGKSWTILYPEEKIKYFTESVFPVLGEKGHWEGEDVGICKDGSLQPEKVYLTLLPDGGLVCTCIKLD